MKPFCQKLTGHLLLTFFEDGYKNEIFGHYSTIFNSNFFATKAAITPFTRN